MRKKCIATIMLASMVCGLLGCGNESPEVNQGNDSTDTAKVSSSEVVTPEDVNLVVWSPSEDQDPEYGEWIVTMCNKFNDLHPEWNITFEYGVCSESSAKKLVPQDIDAAADVFLYGSTGLENLCEANCVTEFGGKYLETIRANYPESMVSCITYTDGGVYGVPITTDTYFMYYDKSVFSEDDVKSLETMLSKGKVAIPLTNGFYNASFFSGVSETAFFGLNGKDRANGIKVNTSDGLAVTKYMIDLVKNNNFICAEPADAISMMREGTCSAYFCGTWQAAQTEDVLGENFGVAILPSIQLNGKSVQLRPFTSAKAVGVKSTTKYPQVAIELAIYLGGYDAQLSHYELRGYVPCQNDVLKVEKVINDPVVQVDATTVSGIAIPRGCFSEFAYYWTPAESFGTEIRDGIITYQNAAEKLAAFEKAANSSGVN